MDETTKTAGEAQRARPRWHLIAIAVAVALVSTVGVAAASGVKVKIEGDGPGKAKLECNGGMTRLGHVFDETASLFPGDPAVQIDVLNTIPVDFFLLENVSTGTHTSTHIDAPGHFIEGARTIDELRAEEFVWPVYVIDVRDRMAAEGPDFQLTIEDIEAWEDENKKINKDGGLVIIQTGFETKFGTAAYVDDVAPGFSGAAVQWLFDERNISGVGSDSLGPDASTDELFDATFTALANDGISMPGLRNVDSLNTHGDIIIASAVALRDGSGYQVDPLACHAK